MSLVASLLRLFPRFRVARAPRFIAPTYRFLWYAIDLIKLRHKAIFAFVSDYPWHAVSLAYFFKTVPRNELFIHMF